MQKARQAAQRKMLEQEQVSERHSTKQAHLGHAKQRRIERGVARDDEMVALKRENSRLRKERDFLKEAATFFASDQKRSIR